MVETTTCQECGSELPLNAPQGLCPRCLVGMGINLSVSAGSGISDRMTASQDSVATGKLREFGDYELLEEIARGGMGVVYKARQKSLNRMVAVKMLLFGEFSSHEFVRRFRAEAEAVASLQHPNIVTIHEIGELDGQHYFSMDYVKGQNLSQLARDNPLPPEVAADYVRTVAQAIDYAHQHGVLHRDLKPSNVLVDPLDRPRVTDFGLAKRLQDESDLTVSGQTLGTPSYMSPEQAAGHHRQIGITSDVYSLGALLYFLLTGRAPFLGEGLQDTIRQVLEAEPVSPRLLNPGIPKDLETICLKCLAKEPRGRYATARTLAEELDRWLAGKPILARPAGRPEKVWRWCRRQPVIASLICSVALLLVSGATGSTWMFMREKSPRAYAEKLRRESELHEAKAQNEAAKLSLVRGFLYSFLENVPKIVTPGDNTPTVLASLHEFSKILAEEFRDQPEAEAELRLKLASIYHEMGFYEAMKDMADATLQLVRKRLGQENPAFLTALNQLGDSLMHLYQFPEAEAVSRQALELQKSRFGPESQEVISGLSLLGIVLQRGGKPWQAEATFMEALESQQKLKPKDEAWAAGLWENIALARHDEQRLDEAEKLLREVLDFRRRTLGETNQGVATSLHNLARTLYDQGRLDEAEPMLAEALRSRRSALGEHPSVATSLYVMGLILCEQGKLSEAESTHREALGIRRKRYGTEHPVVAESLDGLGTTLARRGQLNDAERVLSEAVRIRRKSLGDQHPYVGDSLGHLLLVLEQEGKAEEAAQPVAGLLGTPSVGPHVLRVTARSFARRKEWDKATSQAAAALNVESRDYRNYCTLAPLLVASGETNGSYEICARMANQFGATTNRALAEPLAKASLILPGNSPEFASISNWLATLGNIEINNRFAGRFRLTSALAEYRMGDFSGSVAKARKSLEATGTSPGEQAQAGLIVAMAQFHLNQAGSPTALATACGVFESKLPRLDCGELDQDWADYVTAYALLAEAKGLLKKENNTVQALR